MVRAHWDPALWALLLFCPGPLGPTTNLGENSHFENLRDTKNDYALSTNFLQIFYAKSVYFYLELVCEFSVNYGGGACPTPAHPIPVIVEFDGPHHSQNSSHRPGF